MYMHVHVHKAGWRSLSICTCTCSEKLLVLIPHARPKGGVMRTVELVQTSFFKPFSFEVGALY